MNPLQAFVTEYELRDPVLLGDGAYVAHDDIQLWLMTERGDGVVHHVALEPPALEALNAYHQRIVARALAAREAAEQAGKVVAEDHEPAG
jgi:hypothetical protein